MVRFFCILYHLGYIYYFYLLLEKSFKKKGTINWNTFLMLGEDVIDVLFGMFFLYFISFRIHILFLFIIRDFFKKKKGTINWNTFLMLGEDVINVLFGMLFVYFISFRIYTIFIYYYKKGTINWNTFLMLGGDVIKCAIWYVVCVFYII